MKNNEFKNSSNPFHQAKEMSSLNEKALGKVQIHNFDETYA